MKKRIHRSDQGERGAAFSITTAGRSSLQSSVRRNRPFTGALCMPKDHIPGAMTTNRTSRASNYGHQLRKLFPRSTATSVQLGALSVLSESTSCTGHYLRKVSPWRTSANVRVNLLYRTPMLPAIGICKSLRDVARSGSQQQPSQARFI